MHLSALEVWVVALVLFAGLGVFAISILHATGRRDPSFAKRFWLQGLLIVLALGPPSFGSQGFGLSLATFACVAAHEVSSTLKHIAGFVRSIRWIGALAPALACLLIVSAVRPAQPWVPLVLGVAGVVLPWLLYYARGSFRVAMATVACALWPGVALSGMAWLGTRRTLLFDVAFLFGVLEVNDAVSFIVGRSFGRHRMTPRLSPHKTWEGFVAGLVAGSVAGFLLSFTQPRFSTAGCVSLGFVLGLLGSFVDLSASALKRAARMKDFGSWLGPHGGFMDAYDAYVLAAPFWSALIAFTDR